MHFKLLFTALVISIPIILAAPNAQDGISHRKRFSPAHQFGHRAEQAKRNDISMNDKSRWKNRRRQRCLAPNANNSTAPATTSSQQAQPSPSDPPAYTPPAYTPPPEEPPVETPEPQPAPSAPNQNAQAYLDVHNSARSAHGAAPLTWADDLAASAQQWANKCVFEHSGGSLGPFGENLAAGTGSSMDAAGAVQAWVDEESDYNSNNPVPSHYTQVVWKGSTQVGCAVATCGGGTIFAASYGSSQYHVCEYRPQGNVIGHFAQNVG